MSLPSLLLVIDVCVVVALRLLLGGFHLYAGAAVLCALGGFAAWPWCCFAGCIVRVVLLCCVCLLVASCVRGHWCAACVIVGGVLRVHSVALWAHAHQFPLGAKSIHQGSPTKAITRASSSHGPLGLQLVFLLQPQSFTSRCRRAPTPSCATPPVINHLSAVVPRPTTAPQRPRRPVTLPAPHISTSRQHSWPASTSPANCSPSARFTVSY